MSPRKVTLYSTIAFALALGAWDLALLFDDEPDNTISSVLADQSWAAGIIGFVSGHLFSKSQEDLPRWSSAAAGVVAVGGAQALGDPLLGFGIAFGAGLFLWPNKRPGPEG